MASLMVGLTLNSKFLFIAFYMFKMSYGWHKMLKNTHVQKYLQNMNMII